jgi:hypothetical protein
MRRVDQRSAAADGIAAALQALATMDRAALQREWRRLYRTEPPHRMSRGLFRRALAYQVQAGALGGLRPAARRRLVRAVDAIGAGRSPSASPPAIKPGTRLLRNWQGVTHEVIVLERGVQYRGKVWSSLSAVAREITGTRWSGPLFFGLKGHRHVRR